MYIVSIMLLVIIIIFPFMALYKAQDIEAEVKSLKTKIIELEEKIKEIKS